MKSWHDIQRKAPWLGIQEPHTMPDFEGIFERLDGPTLVGRDRAALVDALRRILMWVVAPRGETDNLHEIGRRVLALTVSVTPEIHKIRDKVNVAIKAEGVPTLTFRQLISAIETSGYPVEITPDNEAEMRAAVTKVARWATRLTARGAKDCKTVGKRALCLAWAVDPSIFDGSPSLRELARQHREHEKDFRRQVQCLRRRFGFSNGVGVGMNWRRRAAAGAKEFAT